MTRLPPVWQMIREAMNGVEGQVGTAELREWIMRRYPAANRGSVTTEISLCTVNRRARTSFVADGPSADPRRDILFSTGWGTVERYAANLHGIWGVVRLADGSRDVVMLSPPTPQSSDPQVRYAQESPTTPSPDVPSASTQGRDRVLRLVADWLEADGFAVTLLGRTDDGVLIDIEGYRGHETVRVMRAEEEDVSNSETPSEAAFYHVSMHLGRLVSVINDDLTSSNTLYGVAVPEEDPFLLALFQCSRSRLFPVLPFRYFLVSRDDVVRYLNGSELQSVLTSAIGQWR